MFKRLVLLCVAAFVPPGLAIQAARMRHGMPEVSTGARTAQQSEAGPRVDRTLPFQPGEVLTYNVGFSKLILSGSIGQLKLTVKTGQADKATGPAPGPAPAAGRNQSQSFGLKEQAASQIRGGQTVPTADADKRAPTIEFGAEVASKGFFTWLFGIKIEDSYGAVVRADDFGLLRSWKDIDQGDVHRHYETRVDREHNTLSYSESDRGNPGAARVKTGPCPRSVLDLLSAIYFIRTEELKLGNPMAVSLTDVGQIYTIDVIPVKREDVEVEAGKFKSVQLDLKIFDGKYIKRSGQLLVWITDDAHRLPVRARLKSSGSTVNITLVRHQHSS